MVWNAMARWSDKDPKDRRARLVYLTAAGLRANELAMTARAEVITEISAGLSAEERVALPRMLGAVSEGVTAMAAAPGADPAARSRCRTVRRCGAATAVWTAGMTSSPLTAFIPGERDRIGRLVVDAYLQVKGVAGVFTAGDTPPSRPSPAT
ncbi:hypothetical protein [Streptomyces lancefieldiae]|uniref:MarR family transcriptional regulator n=1 Tax=Streptomyces lancefieldiae TaxID=3075520 RepID=A0ABU3APT0_9ACTN|nr:hypothetical protein [Streptomyces sp. DSM 40712]MDT0612204.1 hypothetical protein [Streptomyces sp. DSM 40712]